MKRRWVIRIIFILPILLCIGGWVLGGTHSTALQYGFRQRYVLLSPLSGTLETSFGWLDRPTSILLPGWNYRSAPQPANLRSNWRSYWPGNIEGSHNFFGFRYRHSTISGQDWTLAVPYWFLLLVFSANLYVVWRKTGKPKPGRAFPVELAAKGDRN